MHKKLLTVEDLIVFCEQHRFSRFSSKESGYQICVQIPSTFEKDNTDDPYTLFANVLAFHTGSNRNGSNLTEAAAKKAIKNMAYKPVLANFCEIDGVRDFTSHDFEINDDGDITYIERQVGCFTADASYMKEDAEHEGRMNVYARIAIPREYTDAADIIERKNGTKCSIELGVNDLSYDSKNKELKLEDVEVMGLTLLGVNPDTGEEIREGMEGAHVQLEDFSVENNSLTFNSKIINEIANAVINGLGNLADNTALYSKEGGKDKVKFNELLEKYNVTVDDVKFEYDNLTDEELEQAFVKAFDDPDPSEPTDQDAADAVVALINALPETVATTDADQITAAREAYDALTADQKALISAEVLAVLTGAETSLGEAQAAAANQTAATTVETMISALSDNITLDDADDVSAANQAYESLTPAQQALVSADSLATLQAAVEAVAVALSADETDPKKRRQDNELTYSVTIDGVTKTYSVSLVDKLNALSTLVNSTYGETDDAWYEVDAFDDEKYVIMHDFWRNKHYRQSYAVKKDVYSLKGDRVEVFARYLTQDEITKLDNMKAEYAVVTEKLAKYEAEPEKVAILNSDDYANIVGAAEFAELKKEENHFDLTVDEVRAKADEMLLAFAKSGKIEFAENNKKKSVGMKQFGNKETGKTGRYGKLFKK